MRRRGRSSLLGSVARTAVVASTAQAAAGRVHHTQQQRFARQTAPPPPPPPSPPAAAAVPPSPAAPGPTSGMDVKLQQLQQLGALRDQGILTDAEFEAQKASILQS